MGIAILREFLRIQPEALNLLSLNEVTYENTEELYENELVKSQATMMIRTFDTVIDSLHQYESVEGTLKQLGKTNFSNSVTESHYSGMA